MRQSCNAWRCAHKVYHFVVGSEEEKYWRVEHPHGYKVQKMPVSKIHDAARKGNVEL